MRGKTGISSFSGFTRRYAEWIAEDTGLEICSLNDIRGADLKNSFLLIGVPVHGQELCEIRKIRKIMKEKDPAAKLIVYATGLRDANEKVRENILKYNFNEMKPDAFFYFTGGLDRDRLSSNDKMMLRLQQMMIGRHPDRTETDLVFLNRIRNGGDFTDRKQILPLISCLKRL